MRFTAQTAKSGLCALALIALTTHCESSSESDPVVPVIEQDAYSGTNDTTSTTDTARVVEPLNVRSAALLSITNQVILPTLSSFVDSTLALKTATEALHTNENEETRAAAQAAWTDAILIWQQAEVLQVGPAGTSGDVAAGQDLRDGIYSWNIVNPCRVDQETASGAYENLAEYSEKAVNVQGLDTLEYLLFNSDLSNACNPMSGINSNGTWDALTDVSAKRAAHSAAVASILHDRATQLYALWDPASGNFAAELSNAGDGSMTYDSAQEALNALTDALFYAEKTTKDMKMAIPLGISECPSDTCPDAVESLYANKSKEHIRANIIAFQSVFLGGPSGEEHTGIDDILSSVGAEDLSDSISTGLVDSINALDAIEGTLVTALVQNPDQVQAAFDATRTVMTLFKTQLMATLNLEVPARAASDND